MSGASTRRPRIGLSSCRMPPDPTRSVFGPKTLLYVEQSMAHWIAAGDALVYPVPTAPPDGPVTPDDWVEDLDGLVLHGGSDVSPRSYGEEPIRPEWEGDELRDRYELDLVRRFLDAGKPVLGICRGLQVLNVAFGGTLWQDLRDQGVSTRAHRDGETYDRNLHHIDVAAGSRLADVLGTEGRQLVNSLHHQGIKELGPGLAAEAWSEGEDLVEAIRSDRHPWCVGLQWHPEFMDRRDSDLLDNGPVRAAFLAEALGAAADEEVP